MNTARNSLTNIGEEGLALGSPDVFAKYLLI
jgi:hypothetical protein